MHGLVAAVDATKPAQLLIVQALHAYGEAVYACLPVAEKILRIRSARVGLQGYFAMLIQTKVMTGALYHRRN